MSAIQFEEVKQLHQQDRKYPINAYKGVRICLGSEHLLMKKPGCHEGEIPNFTGTLVAENSE